MLKTLCCDQVLDDCGSPETKRLLADRDPRSIKRYKGQNWGKIYGSTACKAQLEP